MEAEFEVEIKRHVLLVLWGSLDQEMFIDSHVDLSLVEFVGRGGQKQPSQEWGDLVCIHWSWTVHLLLYYTLEIAPSNFFHLSNNRQIPEPCSKSLGSVRVRRIGGKREVGGLLTAKNSIIL